MVPEELKNMDDAITEWESASRYGGSYFATVSDVNKAIQLYFELRETIAEYEVDSSNL